ncbi:hypothetical protein DF185_18645 [Marinifilum breve]|uniref:Uncharacterized protein n=2 Tax=Marinifilum breve TaxID=2184082 RepID=A0A2V3ZT61_9BACT|nr:hypothetical protein DF185_18645 [Marinifilum breve]
MSALTFQSCDVEDPSNEDETEEFREDIRKYNNSFKHEFGIKVIDVRTKENIDFTYYYYVEYMEDGEKKTSDVKSKYCSGPKTILYNADKCYVVKVTSSGYKKWTGKRKMPINGETVTFKLSWQ